MKRAFAFPRRVAALSLAGALLLISMATTAPAAEKADAPSPKVEAAKGGDASRLGLTIVGDRETPLGLFITPWKNAYPPQREDRPALLVDETARPLDAEAFRRQSNYDEAFSTYRKSGALP